MSAAPPSPTRQAEQDAPLSRRARKKERTRREIYEAAMALFRERGFDRVTVEEICSAADVARGTFFAHFPAKAALLFQFHRTMSARFVQALPQPRGSAVDEIRSLGALLADAWLDAADVMSAMLRELLSTPAAVLGADSDQLQLPELIADIVRRGQQRGELRANVSPRLAAATFLSTSLAILSGGVYREGEATPAEIRQQFLDVVLHGLVEDRRSHLESAAQLAAADLTDRRSR